MKTKKKIMVLCSLCGILFLSSLAFAQGDVTFSSTPNPVGSGARAIGMGGAFIAIADDATAASWNPAGLLQLKKPEFSIMTDYTYRKENNNFSVHPEASGEELFPSSSSNLNINYLSIVYPFNLIGYNMGISLSSQRLYDFSKEFNFALKYPNDIIEYNYKQTGNLYATGFSYCIDIPDLSIGDIFIGVTFNYWGDFLYKNTWEKREREKRDNTLLDLQTDTITYNSFDLKGWNANIGFLFRIKENLTIGGVVKTPLSAEVLNKTKNINLLLSQDKKPITDYEEKKTLNMPLSYGMGISYRFSDEFTLSMDVYTTRWDKFEMIYEQIVENNSIEIKESPITGDDSSSHATTSLRLGMEYRLIKDNYMMPIDFGVFYDPSPSKNSTDQYYGFSFGTGIEYNNRFSFYLAYQFRYGNNVGEYIFDKSLTFSQDIIENTISSSLVIYF